MDKILNIYKPQGATPLQLIQKLKKTFPEYEKVKIGYAGRLDPLAHGVLLLMIGDATKRRDVFLNLPKQYDFTALFGLQTDTYDILGLLQKNNFSNQTKQLQKDIKIFTDKKLGKHLQTYPPFSSKAIHGKPLFWWAKNNKLSEIKIPERAIEIFDFVLLTTGEITTEDLEKLVKQNIANIQGSFRQKEILGKWNSFLSSNQTKIFPIAKFRIHCSSGTYVRGLVHELGKELDSGAMALEILRTSVGEYTIDDSLWI